MPHFILTQPPVGRARQQSRREPATPHTSDFDDEEEEEEDAQVSAARCLWERHVVFQVLPVRFLPSSHAAVLW